MISHSFGCYESSEFTNAIRKSFFFLLSIDATKNTIFYSKYFLIFTACRSTNKIWQKLWFVIVAHYLSIVLIGKEKKRKNSVGSHFCWESNDITYEYIFLADKLFLLWMSSISIDFSRNWLCVNAHCIWFSLSEFFCWFRTKTH